MGIFRSVHMPDNTIAAYVSTKQHSKVAREWLTYVRDTDDIEIVAEYKVPKIKIAADDVNYRSAPKSGQKSYSGRL
jgi:hypothetical protein